MYEMEVSEAELLASWKKNSSLLKQTGRLGRKELPYEEYLNFGQRTTSKKIAENAVHFLLNLGKILCEKGWRSVGIEGDEMKEL